MIKRLIFVCTVLIGLVGNGQTLPSERATDWTLAGLKFEFPEITTLIDFVEAGGDPAGEVSGNSILNTILDEYEGETIEIHFASGTYFFDEGIILPSNIVLSGVSASETVLNFDLEGVNTDLIHVGGSRSDITSFVTTAIEKDNESCIIEDSDVFAVGDWVLIIENDSDLVTSDWAIESTGQILQINEIIENELVFDSPFRRGYDLANIPYLVKLNMQENVFIQNLKIVRLDATVGQTDNINFRYAVNCLVQCIESDRCNFAHVKLEYASNCQVIGSYFYDAHGYGGGGKGYGVVCQLTTGECLVVDNNFKHLRHSMLLQAGANGNVYSYNYSFDPFWTEVDLPTNSAGDLVLHGNYVYANLFEGNIIQNIVIDDSHGKNGPYNTFFRNRAELYGIFMNNSPPTNSQNFIGTEIPNEGMFLGLYAFAGEDHFKYGNNHRGETKPEGTASFEENTFYLEDEIPFYYETYSAWPPIGYPNEMNDFNNEAFNNYSNGFEVKCANLYEDIGLDYLELNAELLIYPNPATEEVRIKLNSGEIIEVVSVYTVSGELLNTIAVDSNLAIISLVNLTRGIYFIHIRDANNINYRRKFIVN